MAFDTTLNPPVRVMLKDILTAVSEVYGVSVEDMQRRRIRPQPIARARHAYYMLARCLTDKSFNQIAAGTGTDHSSVIYGIGVHRKLITEDLDHYIRAVRTADRVIEIARARLGQTRNCQNMEAAHDSASSIYRRNNPQTT